MSWREEALCRELPNVFFYPPLFRHDRSAPEPAYYNLGKMVCEECPVKNRCGVDGEDEEFGLWGGLTPKERWGMRAPRRPSKRLPAEKVYLLGSLGEDPDLPMLHEILKEHLEKRPRLKE